MTSELNLRLAGSFQILLVVLQLFFPKRFHWKEELARLSMLNRQIFIVHTMFICLILLLFGSLSAFAPEALLERTLLSTLLLTGLVIFWGLRLFAQ